MGGALPHDHVPLFILTQGNLLCTTEYLRVTTVLGSCVAVTMHCTNPRMSAICHCMLPRPGQRQELEVYQRNPHRYVSVAMEAMAGFFAASKVEPCDVEVKLFGGADGVNLPGGLPSGLLVGKSNLDEVNAQIKKLGYRLRCSHVGGHFARKLIFDTTTGDVWMKLLRGEEFLGKGQT